MVLGMPAQYQSIHLRAGQGMSCLRPLGLRWPVRAMSSNWDGQRQNSHFQSAQACASQLGYRGDNVPTPEPEPTPSEVLAKKLAELRELDALVDSLIDRVGRHSGYESGAVIKEGIQKAVAPIRMKLAMAVVSAADEATRR